MTNLFRKILDSENLFKNEIDKREFEKIKKDLDYLRDYTSVFVEYKFLKDLKNNLIATNKVTENDLTPFNKWKLLYLYKEYGRNLKKSEYFEEENRRIGSHNSDDVSMINDSLLSLDKFLEGIWDKKKTPRFSVILPESRIHEIEKSIVRYFLYRKENLKLVNEETFLEDYFEKERFISPLSEFFSDIQTEVNIKKGCLVKIWFRFFAYPRIYLFSNYHNTKKVTGYNKKPVFKGKSEYNYNELKNMVSSLNAELLEELSDIFRSDWLKSKILDISCKTKELDIQIVGMDEILRTGGLNNKDDKEKRKAILLELLCFDKKLEMDISLELQEQIQKGTSKNN